MTLGLGFGLGATFSRGSSEQLIRVSIKTAEVGHHHNKLLVPAQLPSRSQLSYLQLLSSTERMSISPLITFKAGICEFDVSRDLSFCLLELSSTLPTNKITSNLHQFADDEYRPAHRLPKSFPNPLPATSTSMKKRILSTSAGGLAPRR